MFRDARKGAGVFVLGLLVLNACTGSGDGDAGPEAVEEVKIGALYPLTGSNASAGVDTLHGVELAAEIVNGEFPEIDLPLAAESGLPGLEGAKLTIVSSDTQGVPEKGASEVDRLVTTEKVAAVVGAYQSAVTLTASQRAERLSVPFVNGESSSVALTERGLAWFFRTGPTDKTFGESFFQFLQEQEAKGNSADRVAIFHTNDQYGTDGAAITTELAEAGGHEVVADVAYDPAATDLTGQVQQVRAAKPDALFVLSFTNDAILLIKTLKQLDYAPPAVMAYGAGFSDPQIFEALGDDLEGVTSRASWSQEIAESNPTAKAVAAMYEERYGQPMSENSARSFTALLTLAQAIDAAGSTDAEAVRDALEGIQIAPEDTIMPWDGIQFDANHQNTGARGVIQQVQEGAYHVIFPSEVATTEVRWPMLAFGS